MLNRPSPGKFRIQHSPLSIQHLPFQPLLPTLPPEMTAPLSLCLHHHHHHS
jgi:hypothetical protein